MPNLYALRLVGPDQYAIAKFDADFNFEAEYSLTRHGAGFRCSCPAGLRTVKLKPCKHQRMLPYMLGAVNTDRFYDPERGQWHQPLPAELSQAAFNGTPEPSSDVPDGVSVLGLDDPALVHNTIAEALGEPSAALHTTATQAPPTAPSPSRPPPSGDNLVRRRI